MAFFILSAMTPTVVLVFLYMLMQLGIGWWISRRIRTEADYLIAGRRLGYTLATFSIFATWFGAETVVGSAGNAYRDGVSLGSAEPFGYGLCLILMGFIFAVPLWRRRLTTLADLFRVRYSPTVERVAAVILIPSSILWAAAQVRAFGQILSTASTGWNVELAIGIAASFTIAYTMFGGLLVDAVNDVIQGVAVTMGLVIVFGFFVFELGGFSGFQQALGQSRGFSLLPSEPMSGWAIAEEWAIPIFGSVLATELVGRIIATRTPRVARGSALMAGSMYVVVGSIPLMIGLGATAFQLSLSHAEQAVPVVARELMPTVAYAAFVGAIISAILSTVDSTLLTASALFSHNLLIPALRISAERKKVLVARGGVLLFGLIAYSLALSAEGVFALVEQASAFGSAGVFVVVCFGLFSSFGGVVAALFTLLIGTASYVIFNAAASGYPFLISLGLSVTVFVLVGSFEQRKKKPGKH
ncbi:MAG TPA: sodium:solute symporter family protein [Longimicrobiales bacterium]